MKNTTYLWRIPDSYPESLIGEYVRSASPDRFLFRQGTSVADDLALPIIRFDASSERLLQYSCLPNNAMVPLVRNDLAALLFAVAPADVQLLKAKILTSDGECDDFFILNATATVVGIDKERSRFSLVPGTEQIMAFKQLAYVDGCLGSHMLARDAEYLSHLLVSAELVDALKSTKVSGVDFLLPGEIAW